MKIILIPSQYILEIKHFLANKYKKQMCYKESKSLFVLNFSLKAGHFQYDHRFILVEKWGTFERTRRYACKKLIKFRLSG